MDVEGLIDGVNTTNLITLSGNQTIPGHIEISRIQVTESIDGDAQVIGPYLDKILPNPSLLESNIINASCRFRDVIVDGTVIIRNRINGIDLDAEFGDIVYATDESATITGLKRFDTIEIANDLTITSGLINDWHVSEFVTSDTDQVLNITHFNGSIEFLDLELGGLFSGINVTELDRDTIKLNGDQYTEAELEIVGENAEYDLMVNEMLIENSINGESVDDIIAGKNNVIHDDVEIDDLYVENLEVRFNMLLY